MKKFVIGLAMIGMCMAMLTGCSPLAPEKGDDTPDTPEEKTGLQLVAEMCEKLPEAKQIVQTIYVRPSGGTSLVQYESKKTFTKGTDSYSVTGTEKTLNALDSGKEEAYTVETVNETLSVGKYSVQLDLNELYFSSTPTYKDNVLTGNVQDSSVENLLGIRQSLPSAPRGMKLRITTGGGHVTGIAIDYTAASSAVEIMLLFTY